MRSNILRLGFLLAIPSVLGCSCVAPSVTLTTALDVATSVFRGVVVRQLKDTGDYKNFVVAVHRVFKGCNFNATEQILVTTGTSASLCEVPLSVNGTYAFSGYRTTINDQVKTQLGRRSRVKKAIEIGSCGYNKRWSQVTRAESRQMRTLDNGSCVAPCTTGVDCRSTQYCDAGTCVEWAPPCSAARTTCGVPPCSVAAPCSVASARCYNNLCGGCQSFFVDSSNTRVCK